MTLLAWTVPLAAALVRPLLSVLLFEEGDLEGGAHAPRSSLGVADVVDRGAYLGLEREWSALVESTDNEPFYRHEYIRSFLDNFLPEAALRIVTGRDAEGRLVAALPLVETRGSMYGLPVRELASPTNVHSFRFDLLAADAEQAAAAFVDHLAADRSWDVVRITDVPEGGKAWQIFRAAQRAGLPVGAWESQRSPYLRLPSSYDELARGLSGKFKANLRRRHRRLEEKGRVSVERLAGDELSSGALQECLALERSGWKGRGGTAVAQSQATLGFYAELLATPGYREHLSLLMLKLDGRPIAFHYGTTYGKTYSLLVTSYDESLKECSPGHLLVEELLKDCISRGLDEMDFLGCDLPWKLDWTPAVRAHHWLYIFRDSPLGRTLCRAKFDWIPAARRTIRHWRTRLERPSESPGGRV